MPQIRARWIRWAFLGGALTAIACSSDNGGSGSDSGAPDSTSDVLAAEGGTGDATDTGATNDSGITDSGSGDAGSDVTEAGQPQHLYVGNDNAATGTLRFTLPLTSSSTPDFNISGDNVVAVALDPGGDLATGLLGGNISYFAPPLSDASVPIATFQNGTASNNGQLVFSADAGALYAATASAQVNVFQAPYLDASTPVSSIVATGLTQAVGVALDATGNLYVSSNWNIYVFAPPYTGAPTVTSMLDAGNTVYRKIVIIGTQLFGCTVKGPNTRVDVYDLPITASSAPAFAITQGVSTPEGIAADDQGNLYVGNLGDQTVQVYSPPFSASSAPTTSLHVVPDGGLFAIFGIAIGP